MALKKVETCIIDATKLLEFADEVAKVAIPRNDDVARSKIQVGIATKINEVENERGIKSGATSEAAKGHFIAAHDLITRAALEELVKCAGVDKEKLDAALKEMEGYRKRSSQNPVEYPVDYAIRLCEATVAELAGYPDRASWHHLQFFP